MQEVTPMEASVEVSPSSQPSSSAHKAEVVSTHVLVPEIQAEKLRELSRRTRIAQSEYLREAVEDLLGKYHCKPEDLK